MHDSEWLLASARVTLIDIDLSISRRLYDSISYPYALC